MGIRTHLGTDSGIIAKKNAPKSVIYFVFRRIMGKVFLLWNARIPHLYMTSRLFDKLSQSDADGASTVLWCF